MRRPMSHLRASARSYSAYALNLSCLLRRAPHSAARVPGRHAPARLALGLRPEGPHAPVPQPEMPSPPLASLQAGNGDHHPTDPAEPPMQGDPLEQPHAPEQPAQPAPPNASHGASSGKTPCTNSPAMHHGLPEAVARNHPCTVRHVAPQQGAVPDRASSGRNRAARGQARNLEPQMHTDARGWAGVRQARSQPDPYNRTRGAVPMRWALSGVTP